MPLQFTTSAQESTTNGVKMLVYGGSGMGKTVLTATLPNVVMLSAESGTLSLSEGNLRKIYPNMPFTCPVPMIKISTVEQLKEAYDWCVQSREAQQFQSVALDSLSEIAEAVLNNAKRQVKDPRQAYGELIDKMEMVVRLFRDLPGKHVYMAAKMEPMKDELSGVVKYGPSMPGAKLGPKLPYYFDFVFRLGVNKTPQGSEYRFLQTSADIQYEAKDRSGRLDAMEYPHLGSIIAKAVGAR
jgi:hypothetical protein